MRYDGDFMPRESFMDFDSCSGHGGTISEGLRYGNRL